ncbi:MAG: EpsI family protein, partial [Burkholderiales bacterium]|nr:EpsI family protein [Burkholderiales bacterium]
CAGVALVAALLLGLPALFVAHLHADNHSAVAPTLQLPAALADGWHADPDAGAAFVPTFLKPAADAGGVYSSPQGAVGLYVAYYRDQKPTSKFVGGENWIALPGDATWNTLEFHDTPLAVDGRTLDAQGVMLVERDEAAGNDRKHLEVRRLHWTAGRWYADDAEAKVANLIAQLRGQGDDGAEVLLYTYGADRAAADRRLQAFAAANLDAIGRVLLDTQARR